MYIYWCEDVWYRSVYRITPTLPHRLQGLELYTHTASGRKGATTSTQLYMVRSHSWSYS